MSVIIPDMLLPRGCGECSLSYWGEDYEGCPVDICPITNHTVWNDLYERAEDCPLVEVYKEQNEQVWRAK